VMQSTCHKKNGKNFMFTVGSKIFMPVCSLFFDIRHLRISNFLIASFDKKTIKLVLFF